MLRNDVDTISPEKIDLSKIPQRKISYLTEEQVQKILEAPSISEKNSLKILRDKGIEVYGVGRNPNQDQDGNVVNKCFSVFDIDDRDVGIPVYKEKGRKRPYVNWEEVEKLMNPILEFICSKLSLAKL